MDDWFAKRRKQQEEWDAERRRQQEAWGAEQRRVNETFFVIQISIISSLAAIATSSLIAMLLN